MREADNVAVHRAAAALVFLRRNRLACLPVLAGLTARERLGRKPVAGPGDGIGSDLGQGKTGELLSPPFELARGS